MGPPHFRFLVERDSAMAGRTVAMFIAKPVLLITLALLVVSSLGPLMPSQRTSLADEESVKSLVQYAPGQFVSVNDRSFPVEPFWFELGECVIDETRSTVSFVLRATPGSDPQPFPQGFVPGFSGAITAVNSGDCESAPMFIEGTLRLPFVCPQRAFDKPLLLSVFFGKHSAEQTVVPVVWSGAVLKQNGEYCLEVDPSQLIAQAQKIRSP